MYAFESAWQVAFRSPATVTKDTLSLKVADVGFSTLQECGGSPIETTKFLWS